jgi:hypothetical protein
MARFDQQNRLMRFLTDLTNSMASDFSFHVVEIVVATQNV